MIKKQLTTFEAVFFSFSLRFVRHDAGYRCIKFESNLIINHFIRKMILGRIRLNRFLIFIQYFSTAVVKLLFYLNVTIEKIRVSHGVCFEIIYTISHLFILNLNLYYCKINPIKINNWYHFTVYN